MHGMDEIERMLPPTRLDVDTSLGGPSGRDKLGVSTIRMDVPTCACE
jgi:hypothetical protein